MSPAQALSSDEAVLLRKDYQLYQMWSISRDYQFGMTQKTDPVRALAWQIIYTDHLPSTYPQKEALLANSQQGLTLAQIDQARQLAGQITTNHAFGAAFSEEQMKLAYPLRDEQQAWQTLTNEVPPESSWRRFRSWLNWLDDHQDGERAVLLDQRGYKLLKARRFPVLYGQVFVKGPESADMVSSELDIVPGGYFVGHSDKKALTFALPGYKTVSIPVHAQTEVQAVPPVILEPLPRNAKTGVVGRVLPWSDLNHSHVMLRAEGVGQHPDQDPWRNPYVPLTVTNNGEFYTTGLAAGRYDVLINSMGLSTTLHFSVKDGEVRGLSLIDLRKGRVQTGTSRHRS